MPYQTDLGRCYYYLPFRAFLVEDDATNAPVDINLLIPSAIRTFEVDSAKLCQYKGITPRQFEVYDFRSNRYRFDSPLPFGSMAGAIAEINSNSLIRGFTVIPERLKNYNLEYLLR